MAIARSPDGAVNGTDLQHEIGMAQSRVRSQLISLAEAELLTAFPRSDLRRWYQRNDSPLWEMSLALYDDWVT